MSELIMPFRASLYVAHLQRINFTGRDKKPPLSKGEWMYWNPCRNDELHENPI